MSEFRTSCEQFLATTRLHFFAGEASTAFQDNADDDQMLPMTGDTHHRAHAGQ